MLVLLMSHVKPALKTLGGLGRVVELKTGQENCHATQN